MKSFRVEIFAGDMDSGAKCTLSKFTPGCVVQSPAGEGKDPEGPGQAGEVGPCQWTKCKVPHLGWGNPSTPTVWAEK